MAAVRAISIVSKQYLDNDIDKIRRQVDVLSNADFDRWLANVMSFSCKNELENGFHASRQLLSSCTFVCILKEFL